MDQEEAVTPPPPKTRFVLIISLSASIAILGSIFFGPRLYQTIELSPPKVLISHPDIKLGVSLAPVTFSVFDASSGAASVRVFFIQNDFVQLILTEQLPNVRKASLTVDFSSIRSSIREGNALLKIEALDSALWENKDSRTFPVTVDLSLPDLKLLVPPAGDVSGASQVLFYQARDKNLSRSGIKVEGKEYLGEPVATFDRDLSDPSLYIVVCRSLKNTQAEIFALDRAGNESTLPLALTPKISEGPQSRSIQLGERFMSEHVRALADRNISILQTNATISSEEFNRTFFPQSATEELIQKFQIIHKYLRTINDSYLASLFTIQPYGTSFADHFVRPRGQIAITYGTTITFSYVGQQIAEGVSSGLYVKPDGEADQVVAANNGTVVFSEDLGVYGNTIVIYHGLGISSLYGHLRAASVRKGATVQRGQRIGFVGGQALTGDRSLYFELRIHGESVNPEGWTDPAQFYKRFTTRFELVKTQLGIGSSRPLDWSMGVSTSEKWGK